MTTGRIMFLLTLFLLTDDKGKRKNLSNTGLHLRSYT